VVAFITQPGDTVEDTQIVKVENLTPGQMAERTTSGGQGKTDLACVIRLVQAH